MILDTSAIVGITTKEDGFELLVDKMTLAAERKLSVASYIESIMVLTRLRGEHARVELDWFLSESQVKLIAVDATQGQLGSTAFLRFGKGRHPAGLNFGDCFSYALAKQTGEPLLFVGNDFNHTDIPAA